MPYLRAHFQTLCAFLKQHPSFILPLVIWLWFAAEEAYGLFAGPVFFLFHLLVPIFAVVLTLACLLASLFYAGLLFSSRRQYAKKKLPYVLTMLGLLCLTPLAAHAVSLVILQSRIFFDPKFKMCREQAKPIGREGFSAWCEMRDQSGPVGSYNLFVYILYDSTDQITLPYEKRSMAWKKRVITYRYRSVFTSAYNVQPILGHFYRINAWFDQEGKGDPVDSDLPQARLKYCPQPDSRIIPPCPGQEDLN